MTKVSNKTIEKKIPDISDTLFGGDTENGGGIVRFDFEAVADLVNSFNTNTAVASIVFLQQNDPALTTPYIWFQTNEAGSLVSIWINKV